MKESCPSISMLLFVLVFFCLIPVYPAYAFKVTMREMASIQMMPIAKKTLTTYRSSDSTTEETSEYMPLTLSLGMNLAMFSGHFCSVPKFIFEMNMTGDAFTFKGIGGALALEIHPLRRLAYDPYLYCNFGLLRMSHMAYAGHGYHMDFGLGGVLELNPGLRISPFLAFTPLSKWQQRNQIGYAYEFPDGGSYPTYAGHDCTHVGLRTGICILFKFLER